MGSLKNYILQHKLLPVNIDVCNDYAIYVVVNNNRINCEGNIGLIGLKPMTIAFYEGDNWFKEVEAIIIEKSGRTAVEISLEPSAFILNGFSIYSIKSSRNYLRNFLSRKIDLFFIALKNKFQKKHKFEMGALSIQQLFDFCVYPRPVYLLSLNINDIPVCFPIDVVGQYSDNRMLVSVRKSNTACTEIIRSKSFCLSAAPYDQKNKVYQLGKNLPADLKDHSNIENKYKFKNSIPYPDFAFQIKELHLIEYIEVGEHYCFYCKYIETETVRGNGQLAHLPWYLLPAVI